MNETNPRGYVIVGLPKTVDQLEQFQKVMVRIWSCFKGLFIWVVPAYLCELKRLREDFSKNVKCT